MRGSYLREELYSIIKEDSSIFEFIQSGSLDGIWYWDLENPGNEWMSPRFWETLGYDPMEKKHLSKEWQEIIFKEDLEIAIDNLEKHCQDPEHPFDQIVRYRHKRGSTVWIRCRGLAIRDNKGKPIRLLGAHMDITALKEAERRIKRMSREYERVFNGTQDAMFLLEVNENGQFRFIRNNLAHQLSTKISLEQIRGKTPQELLGEELGDLVSENYKKCYESQEVTVYEEELSLPGGEKTWMTTLTPLVENGRVDFIVGSAMDITQRKELELELLKYANYDKLTGLPNRRLFFERLEMSISQSERDLTEFALLFIDLDGFKDINDSYGHEAGDLVLVEVGNRLKESFRKSDTVARIGGDEFTAIVRCLKCKEDLLELIDRLNSNLMKSISCKDSSFEVSASIGISIFPENGTDADSLLRKADYSMYQAKKDTKGGYKFYLEGLDNL